MAIWNRARINPSRWQFDGQVLRNGDYSDRYFDNGVRILETLTREGYRFEGFSAQLEARGLNPRPPAPIGDMTVEMQFFARRKPFTIVAGVDFALAILQQATGYLEGEQFINTAHLLEVEAVHDGYRAPYTGDPRAVTPVLKVRGRYRDFALLETPILGALTRMSRIATNTYRILQAARGKPVLFFAARFDLPQTQLYDGYAYYIGVQRYNYDQHAQTPAMVSTPVQASLWNGAAGGTTAHALIAVFLGDAVELMLQFARILPPELRRVALVDFDNDCVGTARAVAQAFFKRYRAALERGDAETAQRYILHGVRPDTSANLVDKSLQAEPDAEQLCGVNPRLISKLREGLDTAWQAWRVPSAWREAAQRYCHAIQIVATGGFHESRIRAFEEAGVPVDVYGVGSAFLSNSTIEGTNNDFTADVVRVRIDEQWVPLAKVGREARENPDLERVVF
ncbi:MAG: nicotinate phosphoribosyltransferase [Fimbriimonadales bacterium]|nr:MAG: nicotinate phosphoribosyltransferase [Fimbriimonadales bacterium]